MKGRVVNTLFWGPGLKFRTRFGLVVRRGPKTVIEGFDRGFNGGNRCHKSCPFGPLGMFYIHYGTVDGRCLG